jgi:hypothetical protein
MSEYHDPNCASTHHCTAAGSGFGKSTKIVAR